MVAVTACLHELIEAQAARTPDAPAVRFEGRQFTYGQLDRRANALARRLNTLGVKPDAPVGLYVERSLDMVLGILAILKAGGAYVPIDPAFPAERVAYMVSDSGASVVLANAKLTTPAAHVVNLNGFDGESEKPAVAVKPEHLAYVIYTSGSTGKPKGVCIEHRNIVNYVQGVIERLRLEPGMSYATVSTIALVTVTSILGDNFGGLGFFILEGYRRSFPTELYFGALPSVGLALLADFVLGRVQSRLTPWRAAAEVA